MYPEGWVWVVVVGVVVGGRGAAGQVVGEYPLPLHLPLCCPTTHSLALNNTCVPTPHITFTPEVSINGSMLLATDVVQHQVTRLACDDGQHGAGYEYVRLADGEGILRMGEHEAVGLVWLPPEGFPYLLSTEYCVAAELGNTSDPTTVFVAKVCHEDIVIRLEKDRQTCSGARCVRKCCPSGLHMVNTVFCLPNEGEEHELNVSVSDELRVVYGIPNCEPQLVHEPGEYTLLATGDVLATQVFTADEYCLEQVANTDTGQVRQLALICAPDLDEWNCPWKNEVVKPVLMSVSCVCLALTWLVYVAVPQLRSRNMGRCLLSFVSAMFIAFVTIMVNLRHREGFGRVQCIVTAMVMHMSILATFCWLSVLSYHIFSQVSSPHKREDARVFLVYSLLAWGAPLLVSFIGLVLDLTEADALRPHFEPPNCWFMDEETRWAYQYGIILVLLLANLVFFVRTLVILRQRRTRSHDHGGHGSVLVYFKLFIISGVLWLTEFLAWQANNECQVVVVIIDIINSLQGVYILLVAVCFRADLKVFHWGWPFLVTTGAGGQGVTDEVTTDFVNMGSRK